MDLEQAYAQSVKPVVARFGFDSLLALALERAKDDEARLARRRLEEQARTRAYANVRTLRNAAARMTDCDLDTAWRAALRGDSAVLDARVIPQVRPTAPKRTPKGTPWRKSGWLRTRQGESR